MFFRLGFMTLLLTQLVVAQSENQARRRPEICSNIAQMEGSSSSASAATQDTNKKADQEENSSDLSRLPPLHIPSLDVHAASPEGFVPKGWLLEEKNEGDLNGDGARDFVLVLHQNDSKNVIKNQNGLGADEFDSNPRILAIVFADKKAGGYTLIADNHDLVPRLDSPTLDDPFESLEIRKGTVRVGLRSWASAGSWLAGNYSYTFRYQNGCMGLIGYDSYDYNRGSLEYTKVSVDYLTKKGQIAKGIDDGNGKDKIPQRVKRVTLPTNSSMPCFQQVGDGFAFQPPIPKDETEP